MNIKQQIKRQCIVSCQALEDEPLHGSYIMARMAIAAKEGGAAGIRANSPEDIRAIKEVCDLPLIGIYKKDDPDSWVRITPTFSDAVAVIEAGADIIGLDVTGMERPKGEHVEDIIAKIRAHYPDVFILADVSTFDEGVHAMDLDVDFVSTTLSGYTPYSRQLEGPDLKLIRDLSQLQRVPVIAEGRIWTIEDCQDSLQAGAFAVIIGTAITRPQDITKRFVDTVADWHKTHS